MSKLNIDQKSIKDLFSDSKADFLIPHGTTNHFSRFIALKQYRHRLIELSE